MFGCKKYPEKYIGDYLISKRTVSPKTFPLLISPRIDEERQRAILERTERQLMAKREEYRKKRIELDGKWDNIAREGAAFKKTVIKFNKFLVENMEKRIRLSHGLEGYKQLVEQRESGIKDLQTRINDSKQHLNNLQENVRSHAIYEIFLNTVLDMTSKNESFKNPHDIIERYEYYLQLGTELGQKQAQEFMILQNAKIQLHKFYDDNQDTLLGLHTQAASLQGGYEDAARRTRALENLIYRIKDKARHNYMDARTTKAAIWNLYKIMCLKKNVPPKIQKDDFEKQLIFISKTLRQYMTLSDELKATKSSRILSLTKRSKKK